MYTIVQFLPEFRFNPFGVSEWLWSSVPLYYINACFICIIGDLIKKIVGRLWGNPFRKFWHAICHVFIYSFSFIEFYLENAFRMRINVDVLMLLLQTNKGEATEFLQTYLFDKTFFFCVFVFAILGVTEWLLVKYKSKLNIFKHYVVTAILSAYFCLGLHSCFCAIKTLVADTSIEKNANARNTSINGNAYIKMYLMISLLRENTENSKQLCANINDTKVLSNTQYAGKIILIIGESHIKRHTSLYGYNKQTYPLLEKMRDSLCIQQDVITPKNATYVVFQEILSVSSSDTNNQWFDAPLFPAIFKDAGWNVVFCSNQIQNAKKVDEDTFSTAIESFLNNIEISNACFTTRNRSKFQYDSQMLDSLLVNKTQNIDSTKPSLYIINLMGQHVAYDARFPKEHTFFKVSDYDDRKDLSQRQKQDVADYDNACRENDLQIYRILQSFAEEDAIIIYMSDHGEEVHDYRDHIGRSYDLSGNPSIAYHCQIDIPFIVYMTESYKRNHSEKAEQVRTSVNRPFMIDDICHLLFYLGEVDTQWFNPSRCLIHPEFNAKRKRIIKATGEDYDEVIRK